LYCCWCAQDIEANHFWESLGFVPLAFRAGSRGKKRIHIFWQKRIRAGDTGPGATPYWFPSQTGSGALREDRLVLPIPPGTHWKDAKPMVLPGLDAQALEEDKRPRRAVPSSRTKTPKPAIVPPTAIKGGGLRLSVPAVAAPSVEPAPKPKREPRPKLKNDPALVCAAREFRDRWLEQVNAPDGSGERLLPSAGKYDVSRALPPRHPEAAEVLRVETAGPAGYLGAA
jgi:hypothetical protein